MDMFSSLHGTTGFVVVHLKLLLVDFVMRVLSLQVSLCFFLLFNSGDYMCMDMSYFVL